LAIFREGGRIPTKSPSTCTEDETSLINSSCKRVKNYEKRITK
jgi:hypothetical protein